MMEVASLVVAVGALGLLTLMWVGLVAGVGHWGERWRLNPLEADAFPGGEGLRLSICVPARDEGENIGRCVRAALASRWPDPSLLELIVVDDRSSDGTGALASQAGEGDARLRVIAGSEPPVGWAGKPWACARAAGEARGDLLLFVDADVVLHPGTAGALAAELIRARLSLLSVFGSWELVSFWERVVIPAVGWFIRGAVNLDHVNDPARPEAFANGQAILVRRADYESLEGHGAVYNQVLDDVRLAEAFKRAGLRVGMRLAPWAFRVRLYRSLREIIHGYAKNLYEGMGRRRALGLSAVVFVACSGLLPPVALLVGLALQLGLGWEVGWGWLCWLAALVGLQVAFRARVERADGRRASVAWAHPLANAILVWILLRSVLGLQVRWKGRAFVGGRARADAGR